MPDILTVHVSPFAATYPILALTAYVMAVGPVLGLTIGFLLSYSVPERRHE